MEANEEDFLIGMDLNIIVWDQESGLSLMFNTIDIKSADISGEIIQKKENRKKQRQVNALLW